MKYFIRKNGAYYGQGFCGYTQHMAFAGIYSEEDALEEAKRTHGDCEAIPFSEINECQKNELAHYKLNIEKILQEIGAST